MLDPLINWIKRIFSALIGLIWRLWRLISAPFRAIYCWAMAKRLWIRVVVGILVVAILIPYGFFIWHAAWIRGYDLNYPEHFHIVDRTISAGEQVAVEGGTDTTRTCGRSYIVDAVNELIDFNVNQNTWMSSHPLYKAGFFGLDWDRTWFLDNKAAFQRGVHQATGRTAIELADALGRVRGTSQIDPDLKDAKGNIQFNQYTWYLNPFGSQPFGPTTPSPSYFRASLASLKSYQARLIACNATFDARADNLMQFLDRIAKDIGSMSASLKTRAEEYNNGWFDTRADDIFMYAKGQLYAYYGILKGARADFADVIETRDLDAVWDQMDAQIRSALELDPLIISNGHEDGLIMPTHLTTMGFYILRVRANMVELRSVLDR